MKRRTKLLGMLSVVLAAALISGCGEQKEDDSKELGRDRRKGSLF